jgi:NAD(P)-dependent dehydrogenase (short-subunit alcohol dehydrogenase family)
MALEGKVVVVAGGAGALGRAVCAACVGAGARVVAADRSADHLRDLAKALAAGERLSVSDADLAEPAGAAKVAADASLAHGRVDALVSVVGAWEGGHPLWETDPAAFDRMLTVNLRTNFLLARAIVPQLLRHGGGAVVAIASVAARAGQAGAAPYAAAKAGLLALLSSLRQEVRGRGVRVNAILPDTIDTEANRRAMPDADFSTWAKPEDIARVVAFLVSDAARVVNGAEIPVSAA